jgi:adenylyl-sulfate kinase
MSQKGFTVWFTGLSGAGKSTLANLLYKELKCRRGLKVERLDGDEVRQNLSQGLGFSKEDRDTNIRRIGYVCSLLARNEVIAIAAAISPYRAIRDENRALIGADHFVEVHVHVPLVVAIQRDTKGLYEKAIRGEIKEFTGVSDPYEPPLAPEVYVDTSQETPAQSFARIRGYLEECGFIAPDRHPERA